jgi:phosphatidate phosphatase APP1
VLLGDNGQQDPVIYAEIVRQHPGRIRVVYIRDVGVPKRSTPVEPIAELLLRDTGVPMLLVPDYLAAATHAAEYGLITADGLATVAAVHAQEA